MILAWPSSVSMTLAGFRSRCTICFSCARARPAATSDAISSTRHHRHPLAGQRVAHLLAANQLHGDVGATVDLADLVNDGDVRMLERGGGLRLLDEAPTPIGVVGQIVGQDLERDIAIQPRVGGAVDNAHAAAADLFSDTGTARRGAR